MIGKNKNNDTKEDNIMLYTEITKNLISSFNEAKIEEVGKIVFTGSPKYSGDELR